MAFGHNGDDIINNETGKPEGKETVAMFSKHKRVDYKIKHCLNLSFNLHLNDPQCSSYNLQGLCLKISMEVCLTALSTEDATRVRLLYHY